MEFDTRRRRRLPISSQHAMFVKCGFILYWRILMSDSGDKAMVYSMASYFDTVKGRIQIESNMKKHEKDFL